MTKTQPIVEPIVEYDPVIKRWRATCPKCGNVAVRAKREAAEHHSLQHITYAHE